MPCWYKPQICSIRQLSVASPKPGRNAKPANRNQLFSCCSERRRRFLPCAKVSNRERKTEKSHSSRLPSSFSRSLFKVFTALLSALFLLPLYICVTSVFACSSLGFGFSDSSLFWAWLLLRTSNSISQRLFSSLVDTHSIFSVPTSVNWQAINTSSRCFWFACN